MNYANGKEIALGFGMALAQNSAADKILELPESEKQTIIDGTHSISSKQEMKAYVDRIAHS